MNGTNVIDSCQSSLARAIRFATGVVNDSESHPSRTCKTSLLLASLVVRVYTGFSISSVLLSDKTLNTISYDIQNCFVS